MVGKGCDTAVVRGVIEPPQEAASLPHHLEPVLATARAPNLVTLEPPAVGEAQVDAEDEDVGGRAPHRQRFLGEEGREPA